MGLHEHTRAVIEDKPLFKRVMEYFKLFGRKATMNKYEIGDSSFKSMLKFVDEHPNYLEEEEDENNKR